MKRNVVLLFLIAVVTLSGCNKTNSVEPPSSEVIVSMESDSTENEEAPTDTYEDADIPTDDTSESSNNEDIQNDQLRVICWGTSLTDGTGGGGVTMPNVLERLSGTKAYNYGGYAENTNCIATRSGASKLTLTSDINIPSDGTPVEVTFESEFGDIELILKHTSRGLNPVKINGIYGDLSREEDENENVTFYFTRREAGDEIAIPSGTVIVPYSVDDRRDSDISIIWTGGNDNVQNEDDIELLISKIDKMIEFSGSDKFLVFSDMNTHEEIPLTEEMSNRLEEYYGEHFVNFRKYLIEDAFTDFDLAPSEEDLEDIAAFEIPHYFRIDDVHGNSLYYYSAGKLAYKKCQELGYLK